MKSKRFRLDRFLCHHFQMSKRQAQQLLAAQQVSVDGKVVNDPQQIVDQFSTVICAEQQKVGLERTYIMFNKPAGVLSATKDNNQTTVMDSIDPTNAQALHIAGRLDKNSTGLLILSNDARWSEQLSGAQYGCEKTYLVTVRDPISDECVDAFAQGLYFDYEGIVTRPAKLTRLALCQAQVKLTEGRYHQIKRMFGRFRNPVMSIHRTQIGPIVLDDQLPAGQFRPLTSKEISFDR
ncbi:16S rRNA pseudouridine(516) synthase [Reinekea marina]|uniref:Pseudouridine synthase n=2 Tax=Reinekea marina TaxID=1310421 RepID=A0ABV7WRF8_9GAMM